MLSDQAITSPDAAIGLLVPEGMSEAPQEEMHVALLDTKLRLLREPHMLYRGTINQTTVRLAELFREAIRANAASIVVMHNHPSGDPTPSPEDVRVTRDMVAAGRLLDIDVADHLVIGRQGYVSLRQRGLGFS